MVSDLRSVMAFLQRNRFLHPRIRVAQARHIGVRFWVGGSGFRVQVLKLRLQVLESRLESQVCVSWSAGALQR